MATRSSTGPIKLMVPFFNVTVPASRRKTMFPVAKGLHQRAIAQASVVRVIVRARRQAKDSTNDNGYKKVKSFHFSFVSTGSVLGARFDQRIPGLGDFRIG